MSSPRSRTVMITGAAGFIGGHAAVAFAAAGWTVIGVDRNTAVSRPHPANPVFDSYFRCEVSHRDRMRELVAAHHPDLILHLAGPASVAASQEDPAGDFESQCVPLIRLMEAIRRSGVRPRLLLISSAAVYGEPEALPVSETAPLRPISPYGFHKLCQELILDEYRALAGLPVCKARIFSTYGQGLRNLAVWDLATRALGGDFTLQGTGEETRDYLHVSDLARALVYIAGGASFEGEAINVASGSETTLAELAAAIYEAVGHRGGILHRGERMLSGTPARWRADVSRLSGLGFEPAVPLAQGIAATIDWIRGDRA